MSPSSAEGVLPVDKPLGWTSHDVVAVVRGILGLRRVGHGGTLDPLATGLLPVLVGPATSFADQLHRAPKVYAALLRFGAETTTDDREGAIVREADVPVALVDSALEPFRGAISQVPPDFAAVKVGGRPAYRRARAGEPLDLAPRTVTIERLAIAAWRPPDLRVLVVCSSGTYIRALARDIGRSVRSAAHLAGLRRLAVGALDAREAQGIEALKAGGVAMATAALRRAGEDLLALDARYREEPADRLLTDWGA